MGSDVRLVGMTQTTNVDGHALKQGDWESMTWMAGTATKKMRALLPAQQQAIKDICDAAAPNVTISRVVGSIIIDAAARDTMADIERDLDDAMADAGIPVSLPQADRLTQIFDADDADATTESDILTREKFESMKPTSKEDKQAVTLPSSVLEMEADAAPSARSKSYYTAVAVEDYLQSPFMTRAQRVETKRQLLAIAQGDHVDVDDYTSVTERIASGEMYPDVHAAVFDDVDTPGVGDAPLYEQDVVDPYAVEDITNLKQTPRERVPAALAVVRGHVEYDGQVALDDIETTIEAIEPDMSAATHANRADDVRDALVDVVNRTDYQRVKEYVVADRERATEMARKRNAVGEIIHEYGRDDRTDVPDILMEHGVIESTIDRRSLGSHLHDADADTLRAVVDDL